MRDVALVTLALMVSGAAICGAVIADWVIGVANAVPDLDTLRPHLPAGPSKVLASDGTLLGYLPSPTLRLPVPEGQLPRSLQEATVDIEDRRFYQHGALDPQGILRAAVRDAIHGGGALQGASTLTMQLVDNVYLPASYRRARAQRSLSYKVVQAKLAEQLEATHGKRWILDAYLNDVPYGTVGGQTAYGVDAAAHMFFDSPVAKLSLAQVALLAGLPQAPSADNPFADPGAARRRRNTVLQAMVDAHDISSSRGRAAMRAPLGVRHDRSLTGRREPYVFDFVRQQLTAVLCPHAVRCPLLSRGGLTIRTTIDLRLQHLARQAIADHHALLAGQGGPGAAAAAMATVDPATGHIEALADSSDYRQTQFDYATQAHRQPGSAFKTFALMELIHAFGGDPGKTYYTSHFLPAGWLPSAPTWSVRTAEETYQGDINLTRATVVSDNTVYAQLVADLGTAKMDEIAHAMGIDSALDGNPSEVDGGLRTGVTPLSMADAYATLANGGDHVPATIIDQIRFPDGSVRIPRSARTTVFPYGEAYAGTRVLQQVITDPSGTGTEAGYGCPAAGKTGTTNDLKDAWFVGYTPRMSTAVWVGYPQGGVAMTDGFGGHLAAPIWHEYMAAAAAGYCAGWPAPATPFRGTPYVGAHSSSAPRGTR